MYPLEKSIRILNRWARRVDGHWRLDGLNRYDELTEVTLFPLLPNRIGHIYAKTIRAALHKAARWCEGNQ
jgi:hypothetical protein